MKALEIFKTSKRLNKPIIFIIAPMLGMVGQATVAFHLQNALSDKYLPVVVGYCSPKIQKTNFNGFVIELPWGSDIKSVRIFFYLFRILYLSIYGIILKPKFVIAQGDTGIFLGIILKFLIRGCICIGSYHLTLLNDNKNNYKKKLIKKLDGIHFVSFGMMEQYKKKFVLPKSFIIYNPS